MSAAPAAPMASLRPRLRGVSHKWAFFLSLPAGAWLTLAAGDGRARLGVAVYAASLAALFGTSALYHRIDWRSLAARRRMRRLDHSMIFVLIAGSYTPFALLVLHGDLALAILIVAWAGALAGVALQLAWASAPTWLAALIYVALGWVALATLPQLVASLGLGATALLAAGGALYTAGAVIYALRRPDPAPTVFGYHEIFHALVIAGAAIQFTVVAIFVL